MIAVSFDPAPTPPDSQLARAFAPTVPRIERHGEFWSAHSEHAEAATRESVAVVLEGEILNHRALCSALAVDPQIAAAELVALAFGTWGVEMLTRMRGSFAISVWDRQARHGLIATDHAALASWYLRRSGSTLLAATGMHVLLGMLPTAPSLDPVKTVAWLAATGAPIGRTFARDVERLGGGHAVLLSGGRVSLRQWWRPVYREPLPEKAAQSAAVLRTAVGSSVHARTPAGEVTGVILSGGFDSAAVTAVAAADGGPSRRLRTYSAAFPGDAEMDESARVRTLVQRWGLPNRMIAVDPRGVARAALEYQDAWGIPLAGPGYVLERPLLEHAASDGVLGILDGQGGDELFGFSPYLLADRIRSGRILAAVRLLARLPDQGPFPSRRILRRVIRDYGLRPLLPFAMDHLLRMRGDATRHAPQWIRHDQIALYLEAESHRDWQRRHEGPLWWRYLTTILTTGRAMLAEYIDHRGKDLALRMRPPLLDVDLVELALRLPPAFAYGRINRPLARASATADLPATLRLAPRKSNLAPFYHQAMTGADLKTIRALLDDDDARIYEFVDRSEMHKLLQRPTPVGTPGWSDWSQAVWVGMTAEIALRSLEDRQFPRDFIERENPPQASHRDLA